MTMIAIWLLGSLLIVAAGCIGFYCGWHAAYESNRASWTQQMVDVIRARRAAGLSPMRMDGFDG